MNITIIGSFKKYYENICNLIDILNSNQIKVLSPKKSKIIDDIEGFVILETDDKKAQPYVIQEHVFENIRHSEFVYVWNPDGYLGNSTCYEIGKIVSMNVPLLFKEMPKDLPIKVSSNQIKDTNELIEFLKSPNKFQNN